MIEVVQCKDCRFFQRAQWHEVLGGGNQKGGYCEVIATAHRMENAILWSTKKLYVHESFGCILGKGKTDDNN